MACKCGSNRIAAINGKCSDMCSVSIGSIEHDGYVPDGLGIGGGDYIDFEICLDCGQVQGTFPLPVSQLEATGREDDAEDEDGEDANAAKIPRPASGMFEERWEKLP